METVMAGLSPPVFLVALAITFLGGVVKGTSGFALPLVMISGLGAFLPPELALAGLILPTLVANLFQAFRQGMVNAWGSARKYRRLIGMIVLVIPISAQFVQIIPQTALLLVIGVPVLLFALSQLAGLPLRVTLKHQTRAEYTLGMVAGLSGGLSGIWGPPVIVFLLSTDTAKAEQVRVQGLAYLIGAVVLTLSHLQTGVLNAATTGFSAVLILPACAGLWLGFRLQDRLDPARFRRWTLVLLVFTGLNLIRRAVMA